MVIVYFTQLIVEQKSLVLIIILLVSLATQITNSPFITNQLNFMEFNLNLTILVSLIMATLSDITDDDNSKLLLAIITILLNLQFIILCLKMVIMYKLHNLSNWKYSRYFQCLSCLKKLAGFLT